MAIHKDKTSMSFDLKLFSIEHRHNKVFLYDDCNQKNDFVFKIFLDFF